MNPNRARRDDTATPRRPNGRGVGAEGAGVVRPLLLLSVVLACGCASGPKWRPPGFAKLFGRGEPEAVAEVDAEDGDGPFKADPATESGAVADAAEMPGHTGETLALIQSELAASDPLEREQLLEDWKYLDDATVRDVIRIRRMVRGYKEPAAVAAAETAEPPPPAVAPVAFLDEPRAESNADNFPAEAGVVTAAAAPREERNAFAIGFADAVARPAGNAEPAESGFSAAAAIRRPLETGRNLFGQLTGGDAADDGGAAETGRVVRGAGSWGDQLDALVAKAETRVTDAKAALDRAGSGGVVTVAAADTSGVDEASLRDAYERAQAELRLLYVIAGNQSRAVRAIPDLPPEEQEFWQQTAWGLLTYFDDETIPDRTDRATQAVSQFRQAAAKLQPRARLELRSLAFSPKINSYGSFERFPRDEFAPGQRVLLYVEIANFASTLDPADGMYRTKLRSRLEVFRGGDESGGPVHEIEFPETIDVCAHVRRDYFHSYDMKIPTQLAAGTYRLKLTVTDSRTAKSASERVNFVVR